MRALKIGFGRTDITPPEPVPLAGYGNDADRLSQSVDYRLYATCLAVTDTANQPVLVYTLDLCVPPYDRFRDWLLPSLGQATGIEPSRILLALTHNHSSPSLDEAEIPSIIRYKQFLTNALIEAARLALADLAPATLQVGSIQTDGLNHVRRYVLEDGTFAGDNYGHFQESPIARHETEPDRQLQLIQILRQGKQDIILANFQMHPHRNGGMKRYVISADIVGVMRKELEKDGCLFAYFTGGSGNVNGHSRIPEENITPDFIAHGKALADYAKKVVFRPVNTGHMRFTAKTVDIPIDHSKDSLVPVCKQIQDQWYTTFKHADYRHLSDPHRISSIYHAEAIIFKSEMPETLALPIWGLSIGDVAFAAAPYEMFDANGKQIKDGSPFEMTFVLTCTNERFAYIPSELGFRNGGYSADLCRFVPGTGELLAKAYVDMLTDIY